MILASLYFVWFTCVKDCSGILFAGFRAQAKNLQRKSAKRLSGKPAPEGNAPGKELI